MFNKLHISVDGVVVAVYNELNIKGGLTDDAC